MTMKLDKSDVSIVIRCTLCPHWWAMRLDIESAYLAAANHRVGVHGEELVRALHPLEEWRKRHAA